MRRALRQLLAQQRADRLRRTIEQRPFAARRGVHGPRRFRTLFGAQGWVDANWPGGDATIACALTGHIWRRERPGVWLRDGLPPPVPQEPAPLDAETAPYWMRPL